MTSHAEVLENPGLLKLELMMRGLRVPEAATDRLSDLGFGVTGHALFGSAGDLDLVLPGGTWVSVPVEASVGQRSPYVLVAQGDGFAITTDATETPWTPVQLKAPSAFFKHTTAHGMPYGRMGTVHGPYMALSPTNHCTFLDSSDRCRFCGVGQTIGVHKPVPTDDIVQAIQIARSEHPVDIVYLSVGHLGTDDGGVRFLESYVQAIKKHFDILVAVDALPPADNGWIERTYGMGVDAVSYNLEVYDPELFERVCPGPARHVGRERFLEALAYASTVFPRGAVTCHLIVGMEPLASTQRGIDHLTELGVLPVLPVYRPFKGRDMRSELGPDHAPPALDDLAELYGHFYRAVRKQRLNLNLVRDIAIVSTPLDARFFSGEDSWLTALRHRMMGTRVGRRTSAVLSDVRRALRVREVSEGSRS